MKSGFERLISFIIIDLVGRNSSYYPVKKSVMSVFIFCCCFNLNLQISGLSHKLYENENGNFLGTLELLGRHNTTLRAHLTVVAEHEQEETRMQAHYLSWRSQNELIEECDKVVVREVLMEIRRAIYYTIIIDGTTDKSHSEQVTLSTTSLNDDNQCEIK